ncbi:MAG: CPBP family intramembrane metalloprotease [Puniceicoccales bacterium]|jgi:membrane protease YdiL (CAAX protease family)|nr:CPBP family intramembrane metalloprotease [Puniceicoccales bacterium]
MKDNFFKKEVYPLQENGVVLFGIFYLCTLFLAALLAPVLFYVTKFLTNRFSAELFQHFIGKGFGKFFNRAQLVSLVILLFPFLKICNIRSSKDIWLIKIPKRKILSTFIIGFIFTYVVFVWLAFHNVFTFTPVAAKVYFLNLFKFIIGAIAIGFLEEVIFRGIIFNLFSRNLNRAYSILLTSLFFAYCHGGTGNHLKFDVTDVTIFSGFRCVIPTIISIWNGFNPLNFLNLTVFGILLSLLLLKNKSLLSPMAFHVGVVLALMNIRSFTNVISSVNGQHYTIGILDTWLSFSLQALAILCLIFTKKRKEQTIYKN